jgi:hypothetical protein
LIRLSVPARDGRLVAHHLDQRLIEGDRVSLLHLPADHLGLGHPLGQIG